MSKVELNAYPYFYPVNVVLLGAEVEGKANFNLIACSGIIRLKDPCVIFVSSYNAHYTNVGIRENHTFSVNFPAAEMVEITDYCGLVSGRDVDKSKLFTTFYGKLGNAPMIEECPVNLECKVLNSMEFEGMEVFVGEVVGAYAKEECVVDGKPDAQKVNPLLFSRDPIIYWKLGDKVAEAFTPGKKFKPGEG
jgi:flavin reductase (DIM6/NTAB) family NADH-FMN oxidoreductase RutF